jgi:hypothetical protein
LRNFRNMESFDLPVNYKGKELLFPANLRAFGYGYKIEVTINGQTILFEPDEERNWRGMVIEVEGNMPQAPDKELLAAVVTSIEAILA